MECRKGAELKFVILHLRTLQVTKGFFCEAQEVILTCRQKEKEERMLSVFHWQRVQSLATWIRFVFSSSEGDWTSIFGHVGAPLDGLCLITRCLVSAGWADGYNSALSS